MNLNSVIVSYIFLRNCNIYKFYKSNLPIFKYFYRRAELHHVAASLKHRPPPSGLYLIDALIKEEGGGSRLTDQWEREGGSITLGMYPPPSIQSLSRIYLLSDVPMFVKHYIVIYFLMDLTNLLDSQR